MNKTARVFDFRWKDEKESHFQLVQENLFGEKILRIGDRLSFFISKEKVCMGSIYSDQYHPCPDDFEGQGRCSLCKSRGKNFAITSFDGFNREGLSEQDLSVLKFPHVVYLAFFDDNLLKVGVSRSERSTLRQLEQGSLGTLYIAHTPDGILARQIETTLRGKGLSDKIRGTQKQDFIYSEIPSEKIHEKLQELAQSLLPETLSKNPEFKEYILPSPEFKSWEKQYHLSSLIDKGKSLHAIDFGIGEGISGIIVSVRGSNIVIETEQELISVNGKSLVGYMVDFTDKPSHLSIKKALQDQLF